MKKTMETTWLTIIITASITLLLTICVFFGYNKITERTYIYDVEMSASLQTIGNNIINEKWGGTLETDVFIGEKGELIIPSDIGDFLVYEFTLTWDLK